MSSILKGKAVVRYDEMGDGDWGAKRSGRYHQGVDLEAPVFTTVYAPMTGIVSHIGQAYEDPDKSALKTIWLETALYRLKVFYVNPYVREKDLVREGDILGAAQDVSKFYGPSMNNHIHVEVWMTVMLDAKTGERGLRSVDPLLVLS